MATTIDLPCPKCGEMVMGDYLRGAIHDVMFFTFMRTSFRLDCGCGFKKTYWFLSASSLEKMYEPPSSKS